MRYCAQDCSLDFMSRTARSTMSVPSPVALRAGLAPFVALVEQYGGHVDIDANGFASVTYRVSQERTFDDLIKHFEWSNR